MLQCVDLAGSERIKKTKSEGVRLDEAKVGVDIHEQKTDIGKVSVDIDISYQFVKILWHSITFSKFVTHNNTDRFRQLIHPLPY